VRCVRRASGLSSLRMGRQFSSATHDLSMFPEYGVAKSEVANGNFKQALPQIQRVHEVISSAMGASSPLAAQVAKDSASTMQLLGDYKGARKVLEELRNASSGDQVSAIKSVQYLCENSILMGSFAEAQEYAEKSVEMCEDGDTIEINLDLVANSYSLLGLSSMFNGDFETSEEYLQLAARWSQNPTDQLKSLNNLGNLHFAHYFEDEESADADADDDAPSVRIDMREQLISARALWLPWQREKAGAEGGDALKRVLGADDERSAKEAIG